MITNEATLAKDNDVFRRVAEANRIAPPLVGHFGQQVHKSVADGWGAKI